MLAAGVLLAAAATPAAALTIEVNTTADAVHKSPGNGVCATKSGKCCLRNGGGKLRITNSTISGNRATGGGGIYNVAALRSNGGTSTLYIGNSIIAQNIDNKFKSSDDYGPDCHSKSPGKFTSFRGNLVGVVNENGNMKDSTWSGTPFDRVGSEGSPLDPLLGSAGGQWR